MREEISLSLDPGIVAMAREHAIHAKVGLSSWVEKAIRDRVADEDIEVYEQWRATLSEEDLAVEAALDAAAHADLEADLRMVA